MAIGLGFLFVQYLFDPVFYKKIIEDSLTQTFGSAVSIGEARISLWEGVGVTFDDLHIRDRSGSFDFVQSKKLFLKVRILPLLKKEVQWKRIILERPTLRLLRNPQGQFNFAEGLQTGEGSKDFPKKMIETLATLFGGSFSIREGHVVFVDQGLGGPDVDTEIRSFNLEVSRISYRDPFPFRMSGKMGEPKQEGLFSISGTLQDIPEDLDLSKGKIDAKVEVKGIDTSRLWPYLKRWFPMKNLAGTLTLSGQYQGDLAGVFKAKVRIGLKEVVFDWPEVFSYVHTPEWANLGLEIDSGRDEIKIPQVSVELPEIRVRAKGRIYGIGTGGMGMEAEAQSDPFDLADAKRLIPYRIITPDVSDALFRGEGKGSLQIVSAKLSGKMPEIDHCDRLENAHVLSVELKLNGVRVKLPWNLPAFDGLKGNLVFKDGHLNLNKIEGIVYHSTLENVQGVFRELLQTSTLQVETEGRFDLKDLPSLTKTDLFPQEVSEALSSIQIQSGKANYRLSMKGVIKPPYRFEHRGSYVLSNVRISQREVPFPLRVREGRIDLSNEDFHWSDARVEFGQSSLLMTGTWKHGDKPSPLEIFAKGKIDLKNLLTLAQSPLFPEEIRSKTEEIETLSGAGQLSLRLKSPSGPSRFSYEGEFAPKEALLRQKGTSLPLVFREGTVSFSNHRVGFSKMTILCLNSFLRVDGELRDGGMRLSARGSLDLRNLPSLLQLPFFPEPLRSQVDDLQDPKGEAEVVLRWQGMAKDWVHSLREGQVKLRGVSFSHRKVPLPFSQIEGSILLSPERFQFQTFKGKLGETQITVSSTIPRTPASSTGAAEARRRISFQVSSPLLDLDLLLPKKTESIPAPASLAGFRDLLSNWEADGKVEAAQVKYQDLFYQQLKVEMKTEEGRLHVYPFQLKGAAGDFWGEGWFIPLEKGIRFEIKPRVSNMEVKAFMRIISPRLRNEGIPYSGRIHIDKAELQGEGEDFQKIKGSLNGSLRLELENGAIERNNVLSKIFSLLNVSQYFKGRFPDLKTKGLPFREVVAHFQIKDGVAMTEDFLVDSDAMRITGMGKVDLGRNQIDGKVGVHPLGAIDTVLSNIPIAGYILTGKEKAFLSFVYEVKGDLDDPKVEAIPIKSLGEGAFGIIKRILETPIRPFEKLPPSPNSSSNSSKEGKK